MREISGLPLAISAVARVLATDENLKRWQDVENDFELFLKKYPQMKKIELFMPPFN